MYSGNPGALENLNLHHLGTDELWLHYWSYGGLTFRSSFNAFLHRALDLSVGGQQVLAWAFEDLITENRGWFTPPRKDTPV
ncbi:hypothetical protein DM794_20070 [Paenarthrobacter ureafaciens]|nr:hypothetical protein ARZXY2_2125 [Arthrobacter sp. ZXY-2]ERI36909.1 hypothetical protein M707_13695 [Arthrobacter sp. AK-YN10]NWL29326.1 hypothetical protein [Paenarthrobacter ureafaciens]QSZ54047.1 hypothetical protein AYX19_14330 [Paenarthrobacter ureafaciens]GLU60762.1 hypothetical protein Pure01_32750 [Paenarthrobacter ureafaciens]